MSEPSEKKLPGSGSAAESGGESAGVDGVAAAATVVGALAELVDDEGGTPTTGRCLECGSALRGQDYCSKCGQRSTVGPLRFWAILKDAIGTLLDLEQPLLRTTVELLWRPGYVASSWIEGKRRSYTNPVKFAVIMGAIIAIAFPLALDLLNYTIYGGGDFMTMLLLQFYIVFSLIHLIPLVIVFGIVGRLIKLKRTWLDWFVLGLYVSAITAVIQAGLNLVDVNKTWPVFHEIRGILPLIWFCYASWGFGVRGQRLRTFITAVVVQFIMLRPVQMLTDLIASIGSGP